jgi:hypothetical protein
MVKHTPPQVKIATPHSKRKSQIRGEREETSKISLLIILCPLIMHNSTAYTSVPVGKAPCFDGSNYNQ